jgi:S-adenosylmethionine:tRNA ribosyltransferase-isomerase
MLPPPTAQAFERTAYHFELPPACIASHPLPQREASRMLHLRAEPNVPHEAAWQDGVFTDVEAFLQAGDVLVINNTKVWKTRFFGHRKSADGQVHTGKVEVLLLHPVEQGEATASEDVAPVWACMLRPSKKMPAGTRIVVPNMSAEFEVLERGDDAPAQVRVHFLTPQAATLGVEALMEGFGQLPLPHYMGREADATDEERYQTVFAQVGGSQAAPTAGLHFSPAVLQRLQAKGVVLAKVTLNVGLGTFKPVTVEDIRLHTMHGERYHLPQATVAAIAAAKAKGKRVVAVGTTALRTLETAAANQGGSLSHEETGESHLFLYPGRRLQVANALLTNFHLPESTLLMLVAALVGRERLLAAYTHAVAAGYRFYSYGDCMLVTP